MSSHRTARRPAQLPTRCSSAGSNQYYAGNRCRDGGTGDNISGSNLIGATSVKFGTTAATSYSVENGTAIIAVTPPGTGTVNVNVITQNGTATGTVTYTYAAGRAVTSITPAIGAQWRNRSQHQWVELNRRDISQVWHYRATSYSVENGTAIIAVTPPGTGTVNVNVITQNGTATGTVTYTYAAVPAVTSITPAIG